MAPMSLLLRAGLVGQGLRFVLVGGVVSLVYLSVTTVLAVVVGLPFQAALLSGYGIALSVHFTLQRFFVWGHAKKAEYALSLHSQLGRYMFMSGTQYGATVASTSLLPSKLGLSTEAVYLMTAPVVTSANFLMYRSGIFHVRSSAGETACLSAVEEK
jgi:putative flippase GtrA